MARYFIYPLSKIQIMCCYNVNGLELNSYNVSEIAGLIFPFSSSGRERGGERERDRRDTPPHGTRNQRKIGQSIGTSSAAILASRDCSVDAERTAELKIWPPPLAELTLAHLCSRGSCEPSRPWVLLARSSRRLWATSFPRVSGTSASRITATLATAIASCRFVTSLSFESYSEKCFAILQLIDEAVSIIQLGQY